MDFLDGSAPKPVDVEALRQSLGLDRCRIRPFDHQVIGINTLVNDVDYDNGRVVPNVVFLADEMGAGKTKQVIDSAQINFLLGKIDRVVVICPGAVRSVWFDPELGQLAEHLWDTVYNQVSEYRNQITQWRRGPQTGTPLKWIIANYEFLRDKSRRDFIRAHCSKKTLLVLDESSLIKSSTSLQTKSAFKIRERCGRVVELNGTPVSDNLMDLFSQAKILSPAILSCSTKSEFRARYAIRGGWQDREIIGWHDIEDLQRRLKPYVLRRLKKDCIDLPEKMPPATYTVPLSERSWELYKSMRSEMVAWLTSGAVCSANQAVSKYMRLAQIASGFLGGITDEECDHSEIEDDGRCIFCGEVPSGPRAYVEPIQQIGTEKLDFFIQWVKSQLEIEPNVKILAWTRFRPQLTAVLERLQALPIEVCAIYGGQKKDERARALRMLDPRTAPAGPVVGVGTSQTGSMGLNLTAAHLVFYLSNDYSLKTRLQSEDRVHRPGQVADVGYFDLVATGPKGQQTADHTILKSLRQKNALANMTTAAWVSVLRAEEKD